MAGKIKSSSKTEILFPFKYSFVRSWVLAAIAIVVCANASAQQKKTEENIEVNITSQFLYHQETDSGGLNRFVNNVVFKEGETYIYCDSAHQNTRKNEIECFSNVRIIQPGTMVSADYARYASAKKIAYMKGKVSMMSGRSTLQTEELTYDVTTKIGTYAQGGTLQDSNTTVTSNTGTYNGKSKDARFMGNVIVIDPQYHVTSKDLGYNTETKLVTYFDSSVTTSDRSVLMTKSGTYDSKKGLAHFLGRSSVMDQGEYIEADNLNYDRVTGFGEGIGNVIAIDTAQHVTMYCGHVKYYRDKRILWALIKPVMKQVNGKDSLFIRADTFYSAPIPRPGDTAKAKAASVKANKKKGGKAGRQEKKMTMEVAATDTTAADSTRPRFFIGYHRVLIYSDSMQGICDSISYTQSDSTMRMIYSPVVWSRKSQITGDTILLRLDSSKLRNIYVPNNATIISQSGPDKAHMYDQVQGKTLFGAFENNELNNIIVKPNAECIYYSKDDYGAYLGVNQAQSERMRIIFADRAISRIVFEQDVHQSLTPLDKADIPSLHLSRFKWLIDKRPKSKEELFK